MGIFPAMWKVWLYTAAFALIGLLCLVGVYLSERKRTKGIWAGCCLIAIVALAGAYLTGFTFRLNTSAPAAAGRLVYLVPNCLCMPDSLIQTDLDAVRVKDGQIQWHHPIRRSGLGPNDTFVSDDQHVYLDQYSPDAAHLREDVISALDAQTGRQVWQVTSDVGGTLVGVSNGQLVIEGLTSTLFLDAATGQELRQLPIRNTPGVNTVYERDGVTYTCSGVDNALTITATDEATGRTLWTSPPLSGCRVAATPDVLLAEGNSMLAAIRMKDGVLLWQVNEGGPTSGPIIDDNAVITSVNPSSYQRGSGAVTARSISDGSLLWQRSVGNYAVLYEVVDHVVLAADSASDGALVALRASDGKQLWSFPQAYGSPSVETIADGVVILGQSSSRQIMALDLHTGALYWQTTL